MIKNSDIARQGMDSIESHRACLPVVPMPVSSAVPPAPAQDTALRGGTVIIGCPPKLAFGPSQERVKDQASSITSWGAAQQPSHVLPSWGESQQTSSSTTVSEVLSDRLFKFMYFISAFTIFISLCYLLGGIPAQPTHYRSSILLDIIGAFEKS